MQLNNSHPQVTFGVPLRALSVTSCDSVMAIQHNLQDLPQSTYILGGGSNILPVGYLNAHVIKPDLQGIRYEHTGDSVLVTAGAGVVWHDLVLDTLAQGYSGLENLSLIPGSVGAAPIQNIGAYGVELSERLVEVEVLDIQSRQILMLSNEECEFDYRDSIFKHELKGRVIVTHVTLKLDREPQFNLTYGALGNAVACLNDNPTATDVSNAVIQIRRSKLPDPELLGNAGSFFKNPLVSSEQYNQLKLEFPGMVAYIQDDGFKLAAGWLVEQCGLKGYRHGDAGVHDKQALVIVNHGKARAEELLSVAAKVQHNVFDKFGVRLTPEVQIIGDSELIERSGLILA